MKYTDAPSTRRWFERLLAKPDKTATQKKTIRYYTKIYRATPAWLTRDDFMQMRKIYREAHKKGLVVDHIVPLSGTLVCGLHVPWNLVATTAQENYAKANKYWPDCPFEQSGFEFAAQIEFRL